MYSRKIVWEVTSVLKSLPKVTIIFFIKKSTRLKKILKLRTLLKKHIFYLSSRLIKANNDKKNFTKSQ